VTEEHPESQPEKAYTSAGEYQVLAKTNEQGEELSAHEKAILLLKPDALERNVGEYAFKDVLKGLLDGAQVSIVQQSEVQLNEDQVHAIYPVIDEPSEYGDQWKQDVIDHLTSEPVEVIVVEGQDLQHKLQTLKYYIRDRLTDRSAQEGLVVKNLLHVTDADEFEDTYDTIFNAEPDSGADS